ncbi:MAG: 4-alpha-glucanotransferase [Desulfuromonas sp.]|nr:MAG: 4-alpha-glucanotransferase [Desulfuromonas sp.]
MRRAGVLLHPTSLPGGILNEDVERFLDWMSRCGLSVWQILPLGVPHGDRSPYQTCSCRALNPALLPPGETLSTAQRPDFEQFVARHSDWLDDFALFMALQEHFSGQPWSQWPEELRYRETQALEKFSAEAAARLNELKVEQFLLDRRWQEVRRLAHQRGIQLLGDVPISVAYDSAEVWAHPQLFRLDETLQPTVVTGVPPDYFSETGQLWGNPHYDWERMQQDQFAWWRARIASVLRQVDLVRIDHFRGLQALWEVPATEETAINGQWVETPGRQLLEALREDFPHMPFIAEDLGVITPAVTALRNDFNLPGLSVLQFGFDGMADNPHSLQNLVETSVVYTGTHDNNTTCGWFNSLSGELQQHVLSALPAQVGPMPWPLIVAALNSPARLAIIPMKDWLGLGEEHRLNTPGTTEHNWGWAFSWDQLTASLEETIHEWILRTERQG